MILHFFVNHELIEEQDDVEVRWLPSFEAAYSHSFLSKKFLVSFDFLEKFCNGNLMGRK